MELDFAKLSKPFTEAQLRREIERAALAKNHRHPRHLSGDDERPKVEISGEISNAFF